MELTVRIAAAALAGCCAALLLRQRAPALALPLGMAVCAFTLFLTLEALAPAAALLRRAGELSGLSPAWFAPVGKCVVIGLLAKTAGDLCRDSGQSAMAGAVEYGGAAAALWAALPLLETLLDYVEQLT